MISAVKRALSGALLLSVLLISGCGHHTNNPYYFTRFAMDTVIDFTVMAKDNDSARMAMLEAEDEIDRVSQLFGEEDSTSEPYRFNHATRGISTSSEVYDLVKRAVNYSRLSGDAFDITIKPVLDLYGFHKSYPVPPAPSAIQTTLPSVGFSQIYFSDDSTYYIGKTHPGVEIALGGIAKGYAVDRAIRILEEQGVHNVLINAGGDLYCRGLKNGHPWKVGIQDPRDPDGILDVLELTDIAVATSGDYQRYYLYKGTRYHHILNPKTGKPGRLAESATIIAPTTEAADAWATALFVLGPEHGIALVDSLPGIEGMLVDPSGARFYSTGFRRYISDAK